MAGEACKTCGGDSQLLTELECKDCEGTGFERPEIPDVLETLKELIANGPIGVIVPYDTIKSAIAEIERLRKALGFYKNEVEALSRHLKNPESLALEAIITVLGLDSGKRARTALHAETSEEKR